MDAVEYLKEAIRMCETVGDCYECPFNGASTVVPCKLARDNWESANPEKAVESVEKWAKENPIKTQQSEFLKMFPNAVLDNGAIRICPQLIEGEDNYNCICDNGVLSCIKCRKQYWHEEVEDEKHR